MGPLIESLSMNIRASIAILVFPCLAQGAILQFEHSSIGSGSLNGVAFGPSAFTFTAICDTENRQPFTNVSSLGYTMSATNVYVTIAGRGTVELFGSYREFVNNSYQVAGLSYGWGTDIFDGPQSSALLNWDMLTDIGPLSGSYTFWGGLYPVDTSGGQLGFFSVLYTPVTYKVTTIPTPAVGAALVYVVPTLVLRRRSPKCRE